MTVASADIPFFSKLTAQFLSSYLNWVADTVSVVHSRLAQFMDSSLADVGMRDDQATIHRIRKREGTCFPSENKDAAPRPRVLIEAVKLLHPGMDGNKRYVLELLRALQRQQSPSSSIELFVCPDSRTVLTIPEALALSEAPPPTNGFTLSTVRQAVSKTGKTILKALLGRNLSRRARRWMSEWRNPTPKIDLNAFDLVHVTTPGSICAINPRKDC